MCSALQKLSFSLFEQHDCKYILLGHVQSDAIEHRFGRLRQMNCGNFFIGYKQLLESERRIKVVSLLKHTGIDARDLSQITNVPSDDQNEEDNVLDLQDLRLRTESVEEIDLESNELNLLYYISGYILLNLLL